MTTAPSCAIPMRFDVENSSTNLRSTADAHVSSVQVQQLPVQRRAVASRNLAKRNTKHAHTGPLKQTHADAFSHAQARTQLRKHLHADSAAVRWLPMRYKLELRVASRIECVRLALPRRAVVSSAVCVSTGRMRLRPGRGRSGSLVRRLAMRPQGRARSYPQPARARRNWRALAAGASASLCQQFARATDA